jgi:hypothetical protein
MAANTTPFPSSLSGLMIVRMAHDLAGAVSAVNNGIELLSDGEASAFYQESLSLVADSAASASHRLMFFRLAYGIARGHAHQAPASVASVIEYYCQGLKVQPEFDQGWEMFKTQDFKHPYHGKILLVGFLVLCDAMIYGGSITIDRTSDGFTLTAVPAAQKGEREGFHFHDEGLMHLTEGLPLLEEMRDDPKTVNYQLLRYLLDDHASTLECTVSSSSTQLIIGLS